jgi:hypothetical protein
MSYLKMFLDVDWGPSKSPDSYLEEPTKPTKPPGEPARAAQYPQVHDEAPRPNFGNTLPEEPAKPTKPVAEDPPKIPDSSPEDPLVVLQTSIDG